jgi:deoxycytidine triphosphate deaminase
MILSNQGIKLALQEGEIEINPPPDEDQYTTSAVDLIIGSEFLAWDEARFNVPGVSVELNLSKQNFQLTAAAYLKARPTEKDGMFVFPSYTKESNHILGITRERVHLKLGFANLFSRGWRVPQKGALTQHFRARVNHLVLLNK